MPGLFRERADQARPCLSPAALAVQGLRAAVHPHRAARQAGPADALYYRVLLSRPVDERGGQAYGRLGAEHARWVRDHAQCPCLTPKPTGSTAEVVLDEVW